MSDDMGNNEERHIGAVIGRAQERAMLKVLCENAISGVFDGLEPIKQKKAASEDVFSKEIQKWGDEPKKLQGKSRYELAWLIQRKEELYQQATSQCERAQKQREQWKCRAEKLWQLLDDIDTAGDQYKDDWVKLREFIWRMVARRGKILVSNGHTLSVPEGE